MYHIPLKTRIRIKVRNFLAKKMNKLAFIFYSALTAFTAYCTYTTLKVPTILLPLNIFCLSICIWMTYGQAKKVRR